MSNNSAYALNHFLLFMIHQGIQYIPHL